MQDKKLEGTVLMELQNENWLEKSKDKQVCWIY